MGRQQPNHSRQAVQAPPASQIPGLGDRTAPGSGESRKQWIKDSDSAYVQLAKRGGHPNLLHNDPLEARAQPGAIDKPVAKAQWLYDDYDDNDRSRAQESASKASMSTYEFEVSDDAPLPSEYRDGRDSPTTSHYNNEQYLESPKLSEEDYQYLMSKYNSYGGEKNPPNSDVGELHRYESNNNSNEKQQTAANSTAIRTQRQEQMNMAQANRMKQTNGSEISRLLSFDYLTDKSKAAISNSSQMNSVGSSSTENRRKLSEMDRRDKFTEQDLDGYYDDDKRQARPNHEVDNQRASNYSNTNNSRNNHSNVPCYQTQHDQSQMTNQKYGLKRGDSASSYTTEYQDKMVSSKSSGALTSTANRTNGSSGNSNGIAGQRSRSIQNLDMRTISKQKDDNRPEFFSIGSGTPTMAGPPQYGRRKASAELRPDFFTGQTSGEPVVPPNMYAKKRSDPEERPDFLKIASSPSPYADYTETQQRQTGPDEQDIMEKLNKYQIGTQRTNYRRKKMDIDVVSPPSAGVQRRK